jgi:hypothetical protein
MAMTKNAAIGGFVRSTIGLGGVTAMALVAAGLAPMAPANAQATPPAPLRLDIPAPAAAPSIATEAQARLALSRHGLTDVTQMGPVGDYWEANARDRGERVVAYLFADGTLRLDRHPKATVEVGARLTPGAS